MIKTIMIKKSIIQLDGEYNKIQKYYIVFFAY